MEISERSVVDFLKDTNNIQYGHAGKVMPIDVSKLGKLVWIYWKGVGVFQPTPL